MSDTNEPGDLLPSQEQWEQSVRDAMRPTSGPARVSWTERAGQRWDLHGECPNCRHHTSKIVSDAVVSDVAFEAATEVELNWACACKAAAHCQGERGCGAGEGFYIAVPAPGR